MRESLAEEKGKGSNPPGNNDPVWEGEMRYIQYPVINHNGKEYKKGMYTCV